MRAWPLVGRTRPSSTLTVVVLPAPFGPRKPKTSPGSTVRVRSCRATFRPYALWRLVISTAGADRGPAVKSEAAGVGLVETAGNSLDVAGLQAPAPNPERLTAVGLIAVVVLVVLVV